MANIKSQHVPLRKTVTIGLPQVDAPLTPRVTVQLRSKRYLQKMNLGLLAKQLSPRVVNLGFDSPKSSGDVMKYQMPTPRISTAALKIHHKRV